MTFKVTICEDTISQGDMFNLYPCKNNILDIEVDLMKLLYLHNRFFGYGVYFEHFVFTGFDCIEEWSYFLESCVPDSVVCGGSKNFKGISFHIKTDLPLEDLGFLQINA